MSKIKILSLIKILDLQKGNLFQSRWVYHKILLSGQTTVHSIREVFRKDISILRLKLEHIYYNTPEQNGHIESFHRTIKNEYIWPNDFQNYQEAESAIKDAVVDYNQNRIHSALRYLTPYEFISKWKMQQDIEEKKVINIGNEK